MEREFLHQIFLNNTVYNYLISLAIVIFGNIIIRGFRYLILKRYNWFLQESTKRFEEFLRDLLDKRVFPLLNVLLLYFAIIRLEFTNKVHHVFEIILLVITIYFMAFIIQEIFIYGLNKYWNVKGKGSNDNKLLNFLNLSIRVFVWVLALVFLLDNLGIEIKGLLTGLGIGGVAIAFASQALLADIFSYFTIFFDKPFDIGDFIIIDEYRGVVEHIGLKTTRLRSLSGEELIFSNNDLTNSRINNYGNMDYRRINFKIGVVYWTDLEKLKMIPEIFKSIINDIDKTSFDRANFVSYGKFSLIFEIVYYVLDKDYKVYMDIQEKINLKIKERFREEGIEFAYPTQTLYLAGELGFNSALKEELDK